MHEGSERNEKRSVGVGRSAELRHRDPIEPCIEYALGVVLRRPAGRVVARDRSLSDEHDDSVGGIGERCAARRK
jgi:hypothetical protein